MSKTDFFELPIGDAHRECIEVETYYERGVMDERKRWETKRCETCRFVEVYHLDKICDHDMAPVGKIEPYFSCIYHEAKGSG